jgi:hypothetical protein
MEYPTVLGLGVWPSERMAPEPRPYSRRKAKEKKEKPKGEAKIHVLPPGGPVADKLGDGRARFEDDVHGLKGIEWL